MNRNLTLGIALLAGLALSLVSSVEAQNCCRRGRVLQRVQLRGMFQRNNNCCNQYTTTSCNTGCNTGYVAPVQNNCGCASTPVMSTPVMSAPVVQSNCGCATTAPVQSCGGCNTPVVSNSCGGCGTVATTSCGSGCGTVATTSCGNGCGTVATTSCGGCNRSWDDAPWFPHVTTVDLAVADTFQPLHVADADQRCQAAVVAVAPFQLHLVDAEAHL